MSRRLLALAVALVTLAPAGTDLPAEAASPKPRGLLAGAARLNITPFTVAPGAEGVHPLSNRAASNRDGLPGGLWHTFEPEPGAVSAGQVLPTGVWGEAFTDQNANGRYDLGEPHVDDPVNSRLDPDSTGKWDGIYLAGFGNGRAAIGAFDPLWARALYVRDRASGLSYVQVSVDFIGYFSDWNERILSTARALDPGIDVDHLILSHTHNHEGPDVHVGLWGPETAVDGTYPKYERYVEVKIAQAIVAAARRPAPTRVRFGSIRPGQRFRTLRGNVEDLAGTQSRNSCRTPWVFDDELRAAQFVDARTGRTIGTLVNWGTHVESLEDDNYFISSDYVHTTRATVERALGGVAVFVNGAQGVVEIIGDSCLRRWQRSRFDGERFPVAEDGEPLVFDRMDRDPLGPRRRTYAIGRVFGNAAVAALRRASFDPTARSIRGFRARELFVPVNNQGLAALSIAGVIDKPAYVAGVEATNEALRETGVYRAGAGLDARTVLYAWRIGRTAFLTAPGELAPEIFWGLEGHHRGLARGRRNHFDYVRPNPAALACARREFSYGDRPGAHTGRPFEPAVRLAAVRGLGASRVFLLGYTPDLLGYIVPGYDFAWYAAPPAHGVGLGALHGAAFEGEAPDPCRELPPDLAFPEARYSRHYHETNSAGSMFAPAYSCTIWDMLGLDPATSPEGAAACEEWEQWRNTGFAHVEAELAICDQTSETDCVRHY